MTKPIGFLVKSKWLRKIFYPLFLKLIKPTGVDSCVFTDGTLLSDENASFIVLAEDDIDDQEFFAESFSQLTSSIKVLIASNGKKAIDIVAKLPADKIPLLVLLDYNLPDLNGADILQQLSINKKLRNVPKMVWSTSESPVYRRLCLELGANEYLVKPFDISSMETIARKVLDYCRKTA